MSRVEADFILIDHASGQARDIRREMERLDRAALRAGASVDTVGTSSQVQRMENLDRSVQRVSRDVNQGSGFLSMFHSRLFLIVGAVGAALPLLTRLSAGVIQLVGSLVQAAGGAGVIGGGALGAFAVGLGSVMALAKDVMGDIKNAQTAFTAYNTAVRQYGAYSSQAAQAQRQLNYELKLAPQGTLPLLRSVKSLGEAWDDATARGRRYIVQVAQSAVGQVRANLPQIAGIVNANVGAAAGAAQNVIGRILSPEGLAILARVSETFRRDLPPAANALGNLVLSFGRLTAAAGPFVHGFLVQFDNWTKRLNVSTSDTEYLTYRMRGLVTEFQHWLSFLTATWHLLTTLFDAATRTHTALSGITATFQRWTEWMRDNPVKMQQFFDRSTQGTHDLGAALMYVVKVIGMLATGLDPVYQALRKILSDFGPPLLSLLKQVLALISTLSGGLGGLGGPLTIMLKLVTGILSVLNHIVGAIPGLGTLLAGALTVAGLYKMATAMGQFVGLIPRAQAEMGGLTATTNAAAAATERLAIAQRGVAGGAGAVAAETGMMGAMFPGRGRAGGFVSRTLGSPGSILALPSEAGGYAPTVVGASGARGFFSRMFGSGRGLAVEGEAGAGMGLLGRGAGMLGRIGGMAGPLSIGLMLASSLAPQGGRLGGALAGASMGSLGMFLGPEVGLPAMAIGALLGGLLGGGTTDAPVGSVQRQLQGYTRHIQTGTRTINMGRFGGERQVPTYRSVHEAGVGGQIRALGGASPHTATQIAGQIAIYHKLLDSLGGDRSQAAQQLRSTLGQRVTELRQVLPSVRQQERHQTFGQVYGMERQLGLAYNVIQPHAGPEAAMAFVRKQALSEWSKLGPEGKKLLAKGLLDWASQMKQSNPALTGQFEALKDSVIGKFVEINGKVRMVNGQVLTDSQAQWIKISKAMQSPVEQAREAISENLTAIQKQAVGTLTAMGFTPQQAMQMMMQVASGGSGSNILYQARAQVAANAHHHGFAAGGRIPGMGLKDTVPIGGAMAAPGELIVNRHTENRVNGMLAPFGASLGSLVANENRPHHLGYATGGRWHGFRAPHAAVEGLADTLLRHFPGLSVTSTWRPGETGSYHAIGDAVDLAAPMSASGIKLMNRAAAWAGSHLMGSLVEGIHNPDLSIKNYRRVPSSFWGASTWAGHANHIHLAALGGGGANSDRHNLLTQAGQQRTRTHTGERSRRDRRGMLSLSDLLSGGATLLPGMPGAIVDTTGLMASAGIVSRMNRILGGGGGGGGGGFLGGGGVNTGGGVMSPGAVASLLRAAGFSGSAIANFVGIARAESGLNAGALNDNPSTRDYSVGLFQENFFGSLGPGRTARYAPRFGLPGNIGTKRFVSWLQTHPGAQASIAHDLFMSSGYAPWRGDSFVSSHHLAGGGRVPWFGDGGDFIARRPRLIGVGDKGPERVTVTPLRGVAHTGTAAGLVVHVNIEHIDATGAPGKIKEVVRGEIRDAIAEVADELDRAGFVPDEGIL